MKLVISGLAYCTFELKIKSNDKRHTRMSERENFLQHEMVLLFKEPNQEELYIEQGSHSFPFSVTLPDRLPTSFEFNSSYIRYSVNAILDIPWGIDKSVSKPLTVCSEYDLNSFPNFKEPALTEGIRSCCCLCCRTGPIAYKFSILKTGFVAGEKIAFSSELSNPTQREINSISVDITRHVVLRAQRRSKSFIKPICRIPCEKKIDPKSKDTWNMAIEVPPCVPSSNGNCRLIDISYSINLNFCLITKLYLSQMREICSIPISVGTVPLGGSSQAQHTFEPVNDEDAFGDAIGDAPDESEKHHRFHQSGETYDDIGSYQPMYPVFKDFT